MDAEERLSLAEISTPTLISAHHLHRYALAAQLCRGLRVLDLACGVGYGSELLAAGGAAAVEGVDIDPGAIAVARESYDREEIEFGVEDALERLHRVDPEATDVIVAFEALEHLPRLPDILTRLEDLAVAGVRLLLSVPNSRAFGEVNEFHLTDFGYDEARAAFDRFPSPSYLYQHLAEGSVILGSEPPGAFRAAVGAIEQGEPEYANTFIVGVGFGAEAVEASVHVNLVATPNHNRYMIELAASNAELLRTNLRLSRGWLGKSDAAAAAAQHRIEVVRAERAAALARIGELEARVTELDAIARHNDVLYQRERLRMNAPRYRAVDKLRDRLASVPLLGRILRFAWRGITSARQRPR
jgi:SAM-dependent methyltransferase